METKLWEYTFSKEDVETLLGKPLTDGEWNIIVDELYNNDGQYDETTKYVLQVVENVLNG